MADNLRPALLYDLGLIEAVKALVEEFRQSEEKIDVVTVLPESEPDLPDDLSLSLFASGLFPTNCRSTGSPSTRTRSMLCSWPRPPSEMSLWSWPMPSLMIWFFVSEDWISRNSVSMVSMR